MGRPVTVWCAGGDRKQAIQFALEEARQRFVSCPQVQQVYYVTGDFDFYWCSMFVTWRNMKRLLRELFFPQAILSLLKRLS